MPEFFRNITLVPAALPPLPPTSPPLPLPVPVPSAPSTPTRASLSFIGSTQQTISHNLGYKPEVHIVDNSGDVVIGQVRHLTNNSFTAYFNYPVSGTIWWV
jgi:hypothetical protein